MHVREYSISEATTGKCLFSGIFDSDLWVGFHGTSNHAVEAIERHGFHWQEATYSREEVDCLLQVFDALFWEGSAEGRGVLATFTQSDFAAGDSERQKAVFFGESSYRSLLYSKPDWAGGESTRAIRRAFKDLDDFLATPSLRCRAYREAFSSLTGLVQGAIPAAYRPSDLEAPTAEEVCQFRRFLESRGIHTRLIGRPITGEPVVPSDAWVRSRIAALESLRHRAEELRNTYTYGVVYAVRFCAADVPFMGYSSGGLLSRRPIPRDRIISKAVVQPMVYEVYRTARTPSGLDPQTEAVLRARAGDGIVSRLSMVRS
jgi:hypothetical protein